MQMFIAFYILCRFAVEDDKSLDADMGVLCDYCFKPETNF